MGLFALVLLADYPCRSSLAVMSLAARDGILVAGVSIVATDVACRALLVVLASPVGPSAAVISAIACLGEAEVEHALDTANSGVWTG